MLDRLAVCWTVLMCATAGALITWSAPHVIDHFHHAPAPVSSWHSTAKFTAV